MPLRVNTNVPGINVQRHGRINNRNLGQLLERLSSGLGSTGRPMMPPDSASQRVFVLR